LVAVNKAAASYLIQLSVSGILTNSKIGTVRFICSYLRYIKLPHSTFGCYFTIICCRISLQFMIRILTTEVLLI